MSSQKPSIHFVIHSFLLSGLVEDVCQVTTSAVLTVVHSSHEDTGTAVGSGALSSQTLDLSVTVDLVVLEDSQLGLLALMLDLLWGSVNLLLALLGTTTKTQDEMESRLLLDVVIGEGTAVFELLSGKDQALLVRRDSFLVLDFGLDVLNGVG